MLVGDFVAKHMNCLSFYLIFIVDMETYNFFFNSQ